jgi:hypothetical protein
MADMTDPPYVDLNNPIDESGANGGIYTRTWTIADMNTTPSLIPPLLTPFSRLINVRVAWNNGKDFVEMSTITRGGGN